MEKNQTNATSVTRGKPTHTRPHIEANNQFCVVFAFSGRNHFRQHKLKFTKKLILLTLFCDSSHCNKTIKTKQQLYLSLSALIVRRPRKNNTSPNFIFLNIPGIFCHVFSFVKKKLATGRVADKLSLAQTRLASPLPTQHMRSI